MGRFNPRDLEGYYPSLLLRARRDHEGGPVLNPGVLQWRGASLPRRECLVLVHGFNVNAGEAARAYKGFREIQSPRYGSSSDRLNEVLGDAMWPGDAAWPGALDHVDALVYPAVIGNADQAGPALAAMIRAIPGIEVVYFLGHSLGCRVVLETIKALQERGYPHVGGACLMAAAVPMEMVEPGGRYADVLQRMTAPVHVLHSDMDAVLSVAFPLGQTLAGGGLFPMALGCHGPGPHMAGNVTGERIEGAGHGDYWGTEQNGPSQRAAKSLADFFRLGDLWRTLRGRDLPPGREIDVVREVGQKRTTSDPSPRDDLWFTHVA